MAPERKSSPYPHSRKRRKNSWTLTNLQWIYLARKVWYGVYLNRSSTCTVIINCDNANNEVYVHVGCVWKLPARIKAKNGRKRPRASTHNRVSIGHFCQQECKLLSLSACISHYPEVCVCIASTQKSVQLVLLQLPRRPLTQSS